MDEFVEVTDYRFFVAVAGKDGQLAELLYTVGIEDAVNQDPQTGGALVIQFAAKDVKVGNEIKRVPGKKVTLITSHIVALEKEARVVPKIRPSAASLLSREAAEVDVLKQKHGVVRS